MQNTHTTPLAKSSFDPIAYFLIARPDHWFKNIFVLPGIALGFFFYPHTFDNADIWRIVLGLVATCLIASSNYVINEVLDAPTDKHHPTKQFRPIPSGRVNLKIAYIEWLLLCVLGLVIGFSISVYLGYALVALWVMGCLYNIPPIRLKDLPYLDVLSESINNPLRLCIGWYMTGLGSLPPFSIIIAYWMFGANLMAIKRFAEFRTIANKEQAGSYRSSFKFYDEKRLIISIVFYISMFAMFAGVFMTRYRLELLFATPLLAYALAYYLDLGFRKDSPVQNPEFLYKEPKLVAIVILNLLAVIALFFYDIPILNQATHPWHIPPQMP